MRAAAPDSADDLPVDGVWRNWPTGDRFAIAAGVFWPNLDTKVRLVL